MNADIASYDEIFLVDLAQARHPLTLAELSYGVQYETTQAWLRTAVERGLVVQNHTRWALTAKGRGHSAELEEKLKEIVVGLPVEGRSPLSRAVRRVVDAWRARRPA